MKSERFWSKVKWGTGCWEWQASFRGGQWDGRYGQFRVANRIAYAHRYAWEALNGPIPDGLEVCHRCDNTRCVRPDHLFLATHRDNILDARSKGRVGSKWTPGYQELADVILDSVGQT